MKKILLLLLFAVSFTSVAQKTYSIDRQLQLERVALGHKNDSVLVRGSDKVVKFIPRSEFGSGGAQDLQQTLTNGNSATIGESSIYLLTKPAPGGSEAGMQVNIVDGDNTGTFTINSASTYLETYTPLGSSSISLGSGIQLTNSVDGYQTQLKFPNTAISNATYTLPNDKPDGYYTLATRDEITGGSQTLDNILNNGNTSANSIILSDSRSTSVLQASSFGTSRLDNSESVFVGIGDISTGKLGVGLTSIVPLGITIEDILNSNKLVLGADKIISENTETDGSTTLIFSNNASDYTQTFQAKTGDVALLEDTTLNSVINNGVAIGQVTSPNGLKSAKLLTAAIDGSAVSGVESRSVDPSDNNIINKSQFLSQEGRFQVVEQNSIDGDITINTTSLEFNAPTVPNVILKFPAPSTSGTYTLGVEESTVESDTTVDLSSSVLEATYGGTNVKRVIANKIAGGSLIYEKTSTGWFQCSITPVP